MALIQLNHVTARIAAKALLQDISLSIESVDQWAIVGPNGCGKSAFGRLLRGRLPILSGQMHCPDRVALVSFESVTELLERERYLDESNSKGGFDPGTLTRDFLHAQGAATDQIKTLEQRFRLTELLNRGLKFLSTGEMRKTLICRALLDDPEILVLDEPFDGLDQEAVMLLRDLIRRLRDEGLPLILLLNRLSDIPPDTTHIARFQDCRLITAGAKEDVPLLSSKSTAHKPAESQAQPTELKKENQLPPAEPLIRMRDVHVRYGDKIILDQLNWTVQADEHWLICGPNGCGKSTLLELISGDNTQAYCNDIELFGRPRGSGESLWQIKQRIGQVSTAFHRRYRVGGSVLSVLASGFYDSIGLYHRPTPVQIRVCRQWLKELELESFAQKPFQKLSFGQRQLVLIARAMVKQPQLLILDEPCQGLDDHNRDRVLRLVQQIGGQHRTLILYVSHRPDDMIPCINHRLQFHHMAGGHYRIEISNLKQSAFQPLMNTVNFFDKSLPQIKT